MTLPKFQLPPAPGTSAVPLPVELPAQVAPALTVQRTYFTQLLGSLSSVVLPVPGQGFQGFQVVYVAKTDSAVVIDFVNARLNGDIGANYDDEVAAMSGAAFIGPTERLAITAPHTGICTGTLATAGFASRGDLVCYDHLGNNDKQVFWRCSAIYGTAAGQIRNYWGAWHWRTVNTPVSSITLLDDGGNNFLAGSKFSVYGLP